MKTINGKQYIRVSSIIGEAFDKPENIYYRIEIDNKGIFRSCQSIIDNARKSEETYELGNQLDRLIGELEITLEMPKKDVSNDVQFAYTKKGYDLINKELLDELKKILQSLNHELQIKEIYPSNIVYQDEYQVGYVDNINESLLLEATRQQLIAKSRNGDNYAPGNQSKGRNRWERRTKSSIASTVSDYNRIDMNAFFRGDMLEFGVKVKGETNNYVVTVLFEHILPELRKEIKRNNNRVEYKCILRALTTVFNSDNVYVSCQCPDWIFSGMNYYSVKQNYASNPQFGAAMQAPKIRNPLDSKGAGCKHINLVLANLKWLLKIASVINNYIHYCKDHMEYNYSRYIFPVLYGIPYEKAVQMSLFDYDDKGNVKDNMMSDEQLINMSNMLGKVRGRYRKGEPSINPRFHQVKNKPEMKGLR